MLVTKCSYIVWNIHLVIGTIYTKIGLHPTWNTVMLSKFKITVNTFVCECLVTQLYPTLCDPMDNSPPGSAVHGDSPGGNSRVGLPWPPPRDLPNQGLNPGLPHCRQAVYHLSHQGSPWVLDWFQGIFLTQESNQCLLHCRQFLYQLSYQGSPNISNCSFRRNPWSWPIKQHPKACRVNCV